MLGKHGLITKDSHLASARKIFSDIRVSITSQGRPHPGAALGSHEFVVQYVSNKVRHWEEELLLLTDVAKSQPHAAYMAFTHCFVRSSLSFAEQFQT